MNARIVQLLGTTDFQFTVGYQGIKGILVHKCEKSYVTFTVFSEKPEQRQERTFAYSGNYLVEWADE